MHESSLVELSHRSINYRIASSAFLPRLKMGIIGLPFDRVKFLLEVFEFAVKYLGVVMGDVDVKVSKVKFANNIVSRS